MSMLTPPGLKGKQYRITGNAYPRLARPGQKRRRGLLLMAGVLAVAVLSWGTFQLVHIFDGSKKHAAAAGACARVTSAAGRHSADGASASAQPGAPASASAPGAAVAPGDAPAPATITLNVYNATNRTGLAAQTAALLKARGFKIGKIGNAPAALQNKVTGAARVTGPATAKAQLAVVGSEVAGSAVTNDTRTDGTVDLVIGNAFTQLQTPAQAAQALALATRPVPEPAVSGAHC